MLEIALTSAIRVTTGPATLPGGPLPDLIPGLGIDPGEPLKCARFVVAMVTVSPGWPASAAWPARMASASRASGDAVGMSGLSEEGPELCGLDDRVGRQSQVSQAAAWIEIILERRRLPTARIRRSSRRTS